MVVDLHSGTDARCRSNLIGYEVLLRTFVLFIPYNSQFGGLI